jgi:hypothetical protein
VRETVFFTGIIVGENRRVYCTMRATRTTVDEDPNAPPEFSDYDIVDSATTVMLPEGDYEVLANGNTVRCKLNRGRFPWRL